MQFVVPQFIDVEAKVIGPISVRQFIILLVATVISFVWYKLLTIYLYIPLIFVTLTFAGGLAFAKVNGQRMHYFLLNLFQTLRQPRLRVWLRTPFAHSQLHASVTAPSLTAVTPKVVTASRLAELSLEVDTGGAYVAPLPTNPVSLRQPYAKK